jgi:hypothetical protein
MKLWVNFLLAPNSEKSDLDDSFASSQPLGLAQFGRCGSGDSSPSDGSGVRWKKQGSGLSSWELKVSLNVDLENLCTSLPSLVEEEENLEVLLTELPFASW